MNIFLSKKIYLMDDVTVTNVIPGWLSVILVLFTLVKNAVVRFKGAQTTWA